MTELKPTNSIQEAVLEKIRAGTVRRRPHWQFVFQLVATVVVSILLLILAAFVVSFIIFSLHEGGEQFLLGFGWRGVLVFLQLFPWLQAILVLVLLLVLERLLQGFKFGYRIPLFPIFLGIIGVSILLGIVFNFTPLHKSLLGAADRGNLPVFGDSYEHIFDSHEGFGVCRGTVVSVSQGSFTLHRDDHDHDVDDGTYTITIPSGSGLVAPQVGDLVLVFGDPQPDGSIRVEHMQMLSSDPH